MPPEGHDGREFLFAKIALLDLFQIVERATITQLHHLNVYINTLNGILADDRGDVTIGIVIYVCIYAIIQVGTSHSSLS